MKKFCFALWVLVAVGSIMARAQDYALTFSTNAVSCGKPGHTNRICCELANLVPGIGDGTILYSTVSAGVTNFNLTPIPATNAMLRWTGSNYLAQVGITLSQDWLDGNAVIHTQTFASGQLTAWTTNGVSIP